MYATVQLSHDLNTRLLFSIKFSLVVYISQYFLLTACVYQTVVSPWPLKASLLYVLLEGDRLYPGGTRCSRHKWSGGTSFSVTDGPGRPFIPETDGPRGPLTRGTISSMTDHTYYKLTQFVGPRDLIKRMHKQC